MNKILSVLFFLFSFCSGLFAASQTDIWDMLYKSGVYENYEVRQKHQAILEAKTFEAVDSPKRVYQQMESEVNVRFEVRKTADAFYLMFLNQFEDRFPVWSSGSYIVKKDLLTGDYLQVKIFLYNDEESYIRIYPEQNRSRLDLYLFNKKVYDGIRVAIPFEKLILLPLSTIISLTENKIPWQELFSDVSYSEWRKVQNFAEEIKHQLPELGDAEDGAMDVNGNYIFIETLLLQEENFGLNCSGFSKWVVDNQYKKITGNNLPVEPLKEKHYNLRGNSWTDRAEEARDPFFGLDWTRNLAYYYKKALYPNQIIDLLSQDINDVRYFDYKDNVGYQVEEMEAVLFLAAVKNPGRFYLGSVNTPFGDVVKLRQHIHVVVFFPYFKENGEFVVEVMERQTVSGLESLKSRYSGEYMHLVNIELK